MSRMKAALLSAATRPCLLCNGPPYVGALFLPSNQVAVAAPAGKIRTIAYSLCEECFSLRDHPKRAEDVLLAEVAEVLRREGN
jgi:hypothetical protein